MRQLGTATALLLALTLVTGVAYPLLVTGLAQWLFPAQANGSLVTREGVAVGSRWIGQRFASPRYFWGRPSATALFPDNALASGGSNLGPLNPRLHRLIALRAARLRAADPNAGARVPVDLVTASASGLDPDITPAGALYQLARVAAARHLPVATVRGLIARYTEPRQLGILGEPRVNVLELNLALDRLSRSRTWAPQTRVR